MVVHVTLLQYPSQVKVLASPQVLPVRLAGQLSPDVHTPHTLPAIFISSSPCNHVVIKIVHPGAPFRLCVPTQSHRGNTSACTQLYEVGIT